MLTDHEINLLTDISEKWGLKAPGILKRIRSLADSRATGSPGDPASAASLFKDLAIVENNVGQNCCVSNSCCGIRSPKI